MKKVFKNNRIIVGLCSVLLAAGVCIGTNHYMISDSAGSVAAESQKADPLTRLPPQLSRILIFLRRNRNLIIHRLAYGDARQQKLINTIITVQEIV